VSARFVVYCLSKKCKVSYITVSKSNKCLVCGGKIKKVSKNENFTRFG